MRRPAARPSGLVPLMLYGTGAYPPFLAALLLLYWLAVRSPSRRLTVLALASVGFLVGSQALQHGLGQAAAAVGGALVLAVAVFRAGAALRERREGWRLALALILAASVLAYFKYLAVWFPALALGSAVAIPVGVSYYTFKHLHYLVESWRGRIKDASLGTYLAYVFFFPMFVAGPIERFANFSEQSRRTAWSWRDASGGLERVLLGLGKKFLIADLLIAPMLPPPELIRGGAPLFGWHQVLFACFAKLLVTYFDFSGYTDMVLGTGRLFGFRLMENFDFPLLRANIAEFWRAWHISLSSWARDYVYFPMLGRFRSTNLALVATMLTIGIWHGASPGWALWGLHHAAGLACFARYRRWCEARPAVQRARNTVAWRVAATAGVWWFVSAGYALTFDPGTFGSSVRLYAKVMMLRDVP